MTRNGSTHRARRPRRAALVCLALPLALVLPVGAATATPAPAPAPTPQGPTSLERRETDELLTLVTKERPLRPVDYAPRDLVDWRGGPYQLRAEVAGQLERLMGAAERDGHALRVVSGYRSYETQAATFEDWAGTHGAAAAELFSARPGHSEHQTGLAVDLDSASGECYLSTCFGDTPEGEWVARHAHAYGFLISYPAGASDVTGYAYEPWHLRYVGPRTAGAMHDRGVATLQEYLELPRQSRTTGRVPGLGWRAV